MSFLSMEKLKEELAKQKVAAVGDKVPSAAVMMKGVDVDLAAFFRNRTGVIFGVPGAFTKTCSETHLPGFRDNAEELKKMVDLVACLAVNDPYVLKAWANQLQISDQFILLSDYNGDLSRRLGLLTHYDKERLGLRCKRFAMICANGQIQWIGFDEEAFATSVIAALTTRPELLKISKSPVTSVGLTASAVGEPLVPTRLEMSECGPNDVAVAVEYCGISKFDFQNLNGPAGQGIFPMTPGHQVTGTVKSCGAAVTNLKVGDTVAVAFVVDSCRRCRNCRHQNCHLCSSRSSFRSYLTKGRDGYPIFGGLAKDMVVDSEFVFKVPEGMENSVAAPLVSAGAIAYAALKEFGGGDLAEHDIGIVGFGAVGHLATQYASKMNAKSVVVFSTNPAKEELATKLGATTFVHLDDPEALDKNKSSFSLVIDTTGIDKEINLLLNLLRTNGTLCVCSLPSENVPFDLLPMPLIFARKQVAGMVVASYKETEEALQFAAEKGIVAQVEVIDAATVNAVLDKMKAGASSLTPAGKCCYVVDIAKTLSLDSEAKSE